MAKSFFVICALISSVHAQCSIVNAEPFFSRSVYEFSIELLRRLAQDTENHFVASTLSPWTLLAYTSLGAADGTLDELKSVLRLHPHKCFNNKLFEITRGIRTPSGDTTLEGTSALFADERLAISDGFRRRAGRAGAGELRRLPLDNAEYAAAVINDYVRSATNGAIDEVAVAGDLESAALVLVDALRFKGSWETPFRANGTRPMPFRDEAANEVGQVSLMSVTGNFNAKTMDELNATVAELPYNDDRLSMLLFVPYEGAKLSGVIYSLKKISLKSLLSYFKAREPEEVVLQLPRFKISSDLNNLKELLIDMGLRSMFDASRASFPYISDYNLYVSNIIQKADVEVTEEGTVASAATKAEFSFKSLPLTVTADKPFFFTIVDRRSAIPIFIGAYSKPSIY